MLGTLPLPLPATLSLLSPSPSLSQINKSLERKDKNVLLLSASCLSQMPHAQGDRVPLTHRWARQRSRGGHYITSLKV